MTDKPLNRLIVIGASTGGPSAITHILKALPGNLSIALLIVQHMPEFFIPSFTKRLHQHSHFNVKTAETGDVIQSGHVFITPFGYDLTFINNASHQTCIELKKNKTHLVSPSIDTTFIAAALAFGPQVMGILLTGMGKDGVKGCLKIKACGGKTIAESPDACAVPGMPLAAIQAEAIDEVLTLEEIIQAINHEAKGSL